MAKTYVTIIDSTGRNILGVQKAQTATTLTIENPVMILVQPQNGQFQVQLITLLLAEFIQTDDTTKKNFSFTYQKLNIAIGQDFNIDPKITSQYDKVMDSINNNGDNLGAADTGNAAPEVIKLFDE